MLEGGDAWFAASTAARSSRRSGAHLLPAFDEFAVGYTDRSAVLDPARAKSVNAGGGILKPIMVVDGRVVGTWQRRFGRGAVAFSPAPFFPLAEPKARAIRTAFRRYADFLGVPAHLDA